jgi:nucleotide-binding universal stress UspA family protein
MARLIMYRKILVALENGPADNELLPHIERVARLCGAELLLVHVADGFAARNYDVLKLAESPEIKADRAYLQDQAGRLRGVGLKVELVLAMGDPATEILKTVIAESCDLIAMASHGHRFVGDLVHGTTIDPVRHKATVPLLVIPAAA